MFSTPAAERRHEISTRLTRAVTERGVGGTIPPHEILPDKAKALAFLVGGKQTFAARVNLPAITMPERSYMRSSLAEMAEQIRDEFAAAVIEVE